MRIENKTYSEERALYNLKDSEVINCKFEGEEDGESCLKETRNVTVKDTLFGLRYPFWHGHDFSISNSLFPDTSRASLWYDENGTISKVKVDSIKFLRECRNIKIDSSTFNSDEFGWKCHDISVENSTINSQYIFLDSTNIKLKKVTFKGKYSFQYIDNMEIDDSELDTKDAFWHSNNVTVRNSIVKGEYLAWFSTNLTLINCKIIGIQPFCYCKNLRLINCTMENTNLAFEYSTVDADIKGNIDSVKNPEGGKIVADSIGEIITDHAVYSDTCKIIIREK